MSHENNGNPFLLVEILKQFHNLNTGFGIEIAGGLIGQNQRRPIDQRARDGYPLLLAAGKLIGEMMGPFFQSHQLKYF